MKRIGYQQGVFDLNHGWRFCEKDYSVLPIGCTHDDVYNFVKAGGYKGPAQLIFDDSGWEDVILPHDWVTKHEFDNKAILNHGYKRRGIGWYRNKFSLEESDRSKQIFLEFEGMSANSLIYLNGQLIYRNFSGYQSFCINISDMANYGTVPNILAVRIDASAWEGWWYEGAGIYRPVWLIKKPFIHIAYQGQWINPVQKGDGSWEVRVETTIENTGAAPGVIQLLTEIQDENGDIIDKKSEKVLTEGWREYTIKQEFSVLSPKLWSPEFPHLYRCRVSIGGEENEFPGQEDYQMTEFGFRTFQIKPDSGFWLNGINRKIKGFCCHQDHAGVGVAVPYAVKEFRIKKLKEMGADSYRCAHNTDPEILEICDKLGMIVMEENRVFSTAQDNMERITAMVKNARNHPSVFFYSIFNEETLQGTGKGQRMAARIQAHIKKYDPTRPVLGAFNGGYMEEQGASAVLEVIGINYNQKMYNEVHAKYPEKPIIASETSSAFAVRGEAESHQEKRIFNTYGDEHAAWGDRAQETWKQVNTKDFVAGNFAWTGFDYRGEPTPCTWPSVSSFFGALDTCGFRKALGDIYEALYKEEPVIHLEPHWTWDADPGNPVRVRAVTNCEAVRLYLNERLIAEQLAEPYTVPEFVIPYEPGALRAEGVNGGIPVCADEAVTAGQAERIRLECSKRTMVPDGLDAVILNIYAEDNCGNIVPDADDLICFAVTGGAEIAGTGNGDPNSHEPDAAESRKLFHGRAQVILRNNGQEPVTFKAFSNSLGTAEITFEISRSEIFPRVKAVSQQVVEGWKLYNRLFDILPEGGILTESNDMNSFEPVSFEGHPQAYLTGKYLKYALFRTKYDIDDYIPGMALYFGGIKGKAWIYMDNRLIAQKENGKEQDLTIPLAQGECGELTVVIQNTDDECMEAGIIDPVFVISEN